MCGRRSGPQAGLCACGPWPWVDGGYAVFIPPRVWRIGALMYAGLWPQNHLKPKEAKLVPDLPGTLLTPPLVYRRQRRCWPLLLAEDLQGSAMA